MSIEKNLTEGSVLKKLIIFSLPFLVSNIVQSLYAVADMLIVGQFGSPAGMSGVNIGGQVSQFLTMVIIGLCVGATVPIGQFIGSGDRERLKRMMATIITLLLIISIVATVLVLFLADPILKLLRTPIDAYAESRIYLIVTTIGFLFIFAYNAFSAILRGMGDSKHPLYFVSAACVTNIVLDIIFIAVFQWGAFGAALATIISQALSVVLCIGFMVKNKFEFDFKPRSFRIYKDSVRMILKIGIPSGIQNMITSLSFLFITAIVNIISGDSAIPSAAVGAVSKFNTFAFMPVTAISMSIATLSAQNFGAGKPDRAVATCKLGIIASIVFMYSFFILVQIFPAYALQIFSKDPALIAAGVTYIRAFSFDFLFLPFVFCINGMLIGGGHSMFSMITGIFASIVIRVPVCYAFAVLLDKGLMGVGMGAPAASFFVLIVILIYLSTGRWKVNVVEKVKSEL